MATEQKEYVRTSQRCKEQLLIDSVEQAIQKQRNLYTVYIDYRKAVFCVKLEDHIKSFS